MAEVEIKNMKYGLSFEQLQEINEVLATFRGVEEAVLFGSRAMDTFKEASDIDIAIKGRGANTMLALEIKEHFSDETYLPFFFDIVAYGSIDNEKLKDHIQKKGVVIFRQGWEMCQLGDVAEINPTERLSKGEVAPKISMSDLQPFTKRISNFLYKEYSGGAKFRNGDTLVARITPCLENGKTAYVNILKNNEVAFGSTEFIVLREKTGNSSKEFLYYFSTSADFRDVAVLAMTGSSGRQRVQVSAIEEHLFLLPSVAEQRAIAEVLSSLDDKIDLLHRQNKTLEALAQTIFHYHFVQNAQDDWQEGSLDDIAIYLNGLACQKHPPENKKEALPVLKIKDLRNGITEQSDWATSDIDEKYIVKSGDIVFSWSGSLLVKIWDGVDCVLNQHLFKVTSDKYPKWFYYQWTKYYLAKFVAIAESQATTMGHIKRSDLSNSMIFIPTEAELNEANQSMKPIINKVILNSKQVRTLENMRETLLPKLVSGDIRVWHNRK